MLRHELEGNFTTAQLFRDAPEGDLEREIGEKDPEGDGDKPEEDDGQEEWETAEKGLDDAQEEDQEEDGGEDQEKEKKKAAAKRKAEKREERRRQDEERKRQEDKRRDDSAKQDATAAERRTKEERREAEHAGSGHGQGQERREDSPGERAGAAYAQPSIDYREAYAIRASEIEEQCERYAKAELMRRELERMKLSGEDTSDAYSLLRDQYRSANDDIRAHHDHFQSIGRGGWQEYAAEAAQRTREASTRELEEHTWNVPESRDYLKQNQDGSYSAYTREEKKVYLDNAYRGGESNVILHGYAEETARHEALKRQEELINASRNTGTPDGMEHYRALLDQYSVTDQEVSRYKSWDTVKRAREESGRMLEKAEKNLESQGFTGVKEYRVQLEEALRETPSRELEGGNYRILCDTPAPYGSSSGGTVGGRIPAGPDPSATIKGPDGHPVLDFREQKFSQAAYEALPQGEERQGRPAVSLTPVGAGETSLKQVANGHALRAYMEAQGGTGGISVGGVTVPYAHGGRAISGNAPSSYMPSVSAAKTGDAGRSPVPGCGGILASAGVSVIGSDGYIRKGTAAQEAFAGCASAQPVAEADQRPRASSGFAGGTARTQAASVKALSSGFLPGELKPLQEGIRLEGDQSVHTGKIREIRQDSLRRIETVNARTAHAAVSMMRNRYLAMTVKQGARTAVQSIIGDTDTGRMMSSVMDTVRLPAHMVKQQLLNMGRTSLDQGDMAMSALNRHIIRSRAAKASALQGDALEKFALRSGLTAKEIQAVKGDRAAMERLVASRYAGTFRTPGKGDMEGIIRAMGIHGDLVKEDAIGTADILGFLSHHGETTLAERSRALKNAEDGLEGITGSQKRLVESLFSQEKFLDKEEMKAVLAKNGIGGDLADKLSGGSWAANGDILAALKQAGIPEDKAGALMKELKGVSMEDRAAMMGLFQLYAGDSLDGFDMDKFRDLLNVLDVDKALKDELNNHYIHLSHLSIEDIKKLLAKYKGNPEAEAFLSRLMNEKVCLVLGRNREMSRFELMNGVESLLFRMMRGTDTMSGLNQVMGLGRGMARVTKSGYRMLYNMVFRRMTSPISIGKLKVTPADLTADNLKAAAVGSVKQTKLASTFSQNPNTLNCLRSISRTTYLIWPSPVLHITVPLGAFARTKIADGTLSGCISITSVGHTWIMYGPTTWVP